MEKSATILIVEDEAVLAMTLCDKLEAEGYEVVGIANNGAKAYNLFQSNSVDLVLCDIHLKGDWDGIETVRRLTALRPVPVVYLTAFNDPETLDRAKQTFPAAYLPKPYDLAGLRMAIELALHNFAHQTRTPAPANGASTNALESAREPFLKIDNHLFLKQGYQFVKISINELILLEADDIYTMFVTPTKKYALRLSLSTALEKLDHKRLIWVHRSYAVNAGRVDAFTDQEITLGSRIVPLGRHYKDEFLRCLRQS